MVEEENQVPFRIVLVRIELFKSEFEMFEFVRLASVKSAPLKVLTERSPAVSVAFQIRVKLLLCILLL